MTDWPIAVVYVAATWAYQGLMAHRRGSGRTVPPVGFFPFAAVLAGLLIGDWWAPVLAIAGLPTGFALNRRREPLRVHEAVAGTLLDGAFIAFGCLLKRLV